MLLKKPTCTLAFDATTLRGTHVNEIHFASDDQMLTASIYELPGGCGADYADHVIDVIDDLSAVRSLYTGEDEAEVRRLFNYICTIETTFFSCFYLLNKN